jgi:D-sedoheptulose 7-phosphate isomerase
VSFAAGYLAEAARILAQLDVAAIDRMAALLAEVRDARGRVFVLGVGGSAANASHLVNDLRKLAELEAYAPTDNVAELTARTNDEGWSRVFAGWLAVSRLGASDALLVLSVGGGSVEPPVSPNLVEAIRAAKQVGARVCGIVGRDGGYTAREADVCVVVPTVNAAHVTPHTESFQSVVAHLLVSHPALKARPTRWEELGG